MGSSPGKPPRFLSQQGLSALLEREAELETVAELLAHAAGGRGSLLILDGPAGIGKSRLLIAAHELAHARGLQVLRARAGELERDFSYGVVRQLYEARLAACAADERAALLAGAARAAAPLFEFTGGDSAEVEGEGGAFATLHGLFWLTANVAERAPTLISVDDLHWCDRPSMRFLAYLARRLEGLPLLLATSLRRGEPDVDLAILADLESEPHATVRPAPLSPEAVRAMLRTALDSEPADEFARAVHGACGGIPLLVEELGHALRAEGVGRTSRAAAHVAELGPEAVGRSVLRRVRRIGASAEALARAVAVLSEDCELSLASELAALDAEEAGAAAAALARVGVLSARGPLGFVHPVLRAAVYAELSDAERSLAHERAAELLTARAAGVQRIAVHLLHARPRRDAAVVETLRDAGRRALDQGAADAARTYLERALAEPPDPGRRAEVLLELGIAELRSGAAAIEHLEEADRLLDGTPRSVDAVLSLSAALFADGRQGDAADLLRTRIERLGPSGEAIALRLEVHLIGWARFDAQLYPMARDRLAAAIAATELRDDSADSRYLCTLAASELARAGEAPARARELVRPVLAAGSPHDPEGGQAYGMALAVLLTLDDLDAAVHGYSAWLEDARRRGMDFSAVRALALRALTMLRRGALAEAEADARIALDAAHALTGEGGHPEAHAFLAEVLLERGRLDEAVATLGAVTDDDERRYQAMHPLAVRARLRIAAGDLEGGLADHLEVGRRLDAFGIRNPSYSAWRSSAALVLRRLGDRVEARRLADEVLALARRWGAPRPIGTALRAAGLLEDAGAGLEHLRASVDVLRDSPALLERAKSLTELGAALRRTNRRVDARAPLQEGLRLAERCNAAAVAQRAHSELLATGARPRRLASTGVDSLTPSERRVARMAADGQTNREIGQALFVTSKTIEMHLSNVYRKLGITSRSELPRVMVSVES